MLRLNFFEEVPHPLSSFLWQSGIMIMEQGVAWLGMNSISLTISPSYGLPFKKKSSYSLFLKITLSHRKAHNHTIKLIGLIVYFWNFELQLDEFNLKIKKGHVSFWCMMNLIIKLRTVHVATWLSMYIIVGRWQPLFNEQSDHPLQKKGKR